MNELRRSLLSSPDYTRSAKKCTTRNMHRRSEQCSRVHVRYSAVQCSAVCSVQCAVECMYSTVHCSGEKVLCTAVLYQEVKYSAALYSAMKCIAGVIKYGTVK